MIKFLKSLFGGKPEQIELQFSNLESWFDKLFSSRKDRVKRLIQEHEDDFVNQKEEVRKALAVLEQATLRNPNIPEKAKQFMEGNREAFIRSTNQALEGITFDPSSIREKLEEYLKTTKRQFAIMQEFFANESRDVYARMAHLQKSADAAQEEEKTLDALHETKKLFDQYHTEKQKFHDAATQKGRLGEEIKRLEKKLEELKQKEKDILGSKQYEEYVLQKKILTNVEAKYRNHEREMIQILGGIEPALKRFERVAMDNADLVQKYNSDPLVSLRDDRDLKIVDIIAAMEKSIPSMDIKDKKKEKILQSLKAIDKQLFLTWMQKDEEYGGELEELEKKLGANTQAKELVHVRGRISELTKKIDEAGEQKGNLEISFDDDLWREKIVQKVRSATRKDIVVVDEQRDR